MLLCLPMGGGLTFGRSLLCFGRWLSRFREVGRGKPAGFHDAIALVDILLDRGLHPTLLECQNVIEAPAFGPFTNGRHIGVDPALHEAGDFIAHRRK